jgi:hypothetical protein
MLVGKEVMMVGRWIEASNGWNVESKHFGDGGGQLPGNSGKNILDAGNSMCKTRMDMC